MHVHIHSGDGEAKFWLDPIISLANYTGLNPKQLKQIQQLVEEHEDEIRKSWHNHFSS